MSGTRDNKQKRGRISQSTRAIFYENLERALNECVEGKLDADKIRYLMKRAYVSRTQAQRLVKGLAAKVVQAPTIDTLAFVAEAFGSNASTFLTQGCKFAKEQRIERDASVGQEYLQRSSNRRPSRRRDT